MNFDEIARRAHCSQGFGWNLPAVTNIAIWIRRQTKKSASILSVIKHSFSQLGIFKKAFFKFACLGSFSLNDSFSTSTDCRGSNPWQLETSRGCSPWQWLKFKVNYSFTCSCPYLYAASSWTIKILSSSFQVLCHFHLLFRTEKELSHWRDLNPAQLELKSE